MPRKSKEYKANNPSSSDFNRINKEMLRNKDDITSTPENLYTLDSDGPRRRHNQKNPNANRHVNEGISKNASNFTKKIIELPEYTTEATEEGLPKFLYSMIKNGSYIKYNGRTLRGNTVEGVSFYIMNSEGNSTFAIEEDFLDKFGEVIRLVGYDKKGATKSHIIRETDKSWNEWKNIITSVEHDKKWREIVLSSFSEILTDYRIKVTQVKNEYLEGTTPSTSSSPLVKNITQSSKNTTSTSTEFHWNNTSKSEDIATTIKDINDEWNTILTDPIQFTTENNTIDVSGNITTIPNDFPVSEKIENSTNNDIEVITCLGEPENNTASIDRGGGGVVGVVVVGVGVVVGFISLVRCIMKRYKKGEYDLEAKEKQEGQDERFIQKETEIAPLMYAAQEGNEESSSMDDIQERGEAGPSSVLSQSNTQLAQDITNNSDKGYRYSI